MAKVLVNLSNESAGEKDSLKSAIYTVFYYFLWKAEVRLPPAVQFFVCDHRLIWRPFR